MRGANCAKAQSYTRLETSPESAQIIELFIILNLTGVYIFKCCFTAHYLAIYTYTYVPNTYSKNYFCVYFFFIPVKSTIFMGK